MGKSCCNHSGHDHSHASAAATGTFLHDYGRLLFSTALLLGGSILSMPRIALFNDTTRLFWYLLAYLPVGLPVLKEAWESLRQKELFNEFTLMTLATLGAFCIGEYPEGVAVMLFYSLGELFQDKAVDRARRNISALMDVRPEKATVWRQGGWQEVTPREVMPGERIEVKTGERVPLDGTLTDAAASFDTAALTGESLPRTFRPGDEVLAGMIAADRVIHLQVTRPFGQSSLSRILALVQDASERKAPAELFIRKFARIYTPVVTLLALLIVLLPWGYSLMQPGFLFRFDEWLYRALVFLVISCPCALVVSIPLSYFGGIGAASRAGILFKGGNYLDAIASVRAVVFDKTGTLTQGTFEVSSCHTCPDIAPADMLQWLASVESGSTHPIAQAIVRHATRQGIGLLPAIDVTEMAARGLKAIVAGKEILAGNLRLMQQSGVTFPTELQDAEGTLVCCAADRRFAGYLLLSDRLKADAPAAIAELKRLGIENIQMLSGDKQEIVTTFADRLGIAHAYGNLMPADKVAHLEALTRETGHRVAFVGDGLNDAPAMALSDVSIAMGGLGSEAAIEAADIVIQTDQPSKVATAIRAGRQTRCIVWQNISLAFGVKLLVMLLGTFGVATLWEAVFADVGVALLAIVNALRIQKLIK